MCEALHSIPDPGPHPPQKDNKVASMKLNLDPKLLLTANRKECIGLETRTKMNSCGNSGSPCYDLSLSYYSEESQDPFIFYLY